MLFLEGVALHVAAIKRLSQREKLDHRAAEIVMMTIRLGGGLALVLLIMSWPIALVFLAVQMGIFGFYMGASFAPNHKGMPLIPKDSRLDFLRRQVLTSRNIGGGKWVDVLMGGLNHQVEHHLFPSMPRPSLRRAKPIVQAYCKEHNIPYKQVSLTAVVRDHREVPEHRGHRTTATRSTARSRPSTAPDPPARSSRSPRRPPGPRGLRRRRAVHTSNV